MPSDGDYLIAPHFSTASDSVDAAVAELKKTLDEMDWSRSFQGETVGERRLRLFPEMQDPRRRKPTAPPVRHIVG